MSRPDRRERAYRAAIEEREQAKARLAARRLETGHHPLTSDEAADARLALHELEAALAHKDAAEMALYAATEALDTAQRDPLAPAPTYRFTHPSEAQRRAMEADRRAAEAEEFILIPPAPFDPSEESPRAFAARMAQHKKQLAAAEAKTAAAFAHALPHRMASRAGLREMFANLKAVAVTFGIRLRDRLFEMAVNHLSNLGRDVIMGLRLDATRLWREAKEIRRQAEHTAAEASRPQTKELDPPPPPRPTTGYDGP